MSAVKATNFRGTMPRISPELLPDQNAQIARNCKLWSGDIVPYPEPVAVTNSGRTGTTGTLFPLRNPDTDEIVWLSWEDEVNVATPSFNETITQQRFYYTGDGVPKVSTYELATTGSAPYPNDYYQLGLPIPEDKPIATATSFAAVTISSITRDSGGVVTFVTSTDHGLRTGVTASTTGFTYLVCTYSRTGTTNTITLANHGIAAGGTVYLTKTSGTMTDGAYTVSNVTTNTFDVTDPVSGATSGNCQLDMRSFATTGSDVIRVDDTTFKMYLPGFQISTYTVTGCSVELSGETAIRSYVYTWYTPWGEESIGSDPSDDIVLREGQTVTITGLPSAKPSDPTKNFIEGIKVYRTFAGVTDSDLFLLKTLWFPTSTATVARAANVSTVTMQKPHNFIPEDRFKITGCTTSSFDITDGVVVDTPDIYTFTYNQAGANVSETADTTGVLYHDAAESDENDARYWGDGSYSFTDDFDARHLVDVLSSDNYNAPPEDLQGLKTIQNNILVGFVRNKVYVSEVGLPHAWPEDYQRTVDADIVAIEAISGFGALILTEKHPYVLTGNDPRLFSLQRIDAVYPCESSKGVVSLDYGIVWPTTEGLAVFSGNGAPRLVTAQIYEHDTWTTAFDPSTVAAVYYSNAYFASHSTGAFVFQFDEQTGGTFVDCDTQFDAAFHDKQTDRLFFASGTDGTVYEWDSLAQPGQMATWKSKVMISPDYKNFGAARVIADYEDTTVMWDDSNIWEDTDISWSAPLGVTFTWYVDKTEIFSTDVTDNKVFRLPTGYKSDTFEYKVDTDVRVRAVHIGETPLSLKEA